MRKKEQTAWTSITPDQSGDDLTRAAFLPLVNWSESPFLPDIQSVADPKAEWYNILLHSNRIEDVEAWMSQFIKGTVIITDEEDTPYIFAHTGQLAHMREGSNDRASALQKLSLAAPGVHAPGQIYLCSSLPLPPVQWPDFFTDLVIASNLVIARRERTQEQLDRQREQWLNALLQEKQSEYLENDGYRLGLPIEGGQLWVLSWSSETARELKATRKRINVENIVLELVKSPLLFLGDDLAVILLEKRVEASAARVRKALLKYGVVAPFWIVQGGQYHAFPDLRGALIRAIALAQKARREKYGEYLLDISTFGLDSLLENPCLARELNAFATRLLTPLLEYDSLNGSHLTETLVLARTLGSAQAVAERLAVHVNTIRYRLHRAEDILLQYPQTERRKEEALASPLTPGNRGNFTRSASNTSGELAPGKDQVSPKEHAATTLAAFIWQHFHPMKPGVGQKLVDEGEQQKCQGELL